MRVKALISFIGAISMYKGEIRSIEKGEVLTDLLNAQYVEVADDKPITTDTPVKPKSRKRGVKTGTKETQ